MPRRLDENWTAFEWLVNFFFKHLIKQHLVDCISNHVVLTTAETLYIYLDFFWPENGQWHGFVTAKTSGDTLPVKSKICFEDERSTNFEV